MPGDRRNKQGSDSREFRKGGQGGRGGYGDRDRHSGGRGPRGGRRDRSPSPGRASAQNSNSGPQPVAAPANFDARDLAKFFNDRWAKAVQGVSNDANGKYVAHKDTRSAWSIKPALTSDLLGELYNQIQSAENKKTESSAVDTNVS